MADSQHSELVARVRSALGASGEQEVRGLAALEELVEQLEAALRKIEQLRRYVTDEFLEWAREAEHLDEREQWFKHVVESWKAEEESWVAERESIQNQLSVVRDNSVRWQEQAEQWKRHAGTSDREVAALRRELIAVMAALDLPGMEPSVLWQDSGAAVLKRIEEIVDEAERGFRERDELREILDSAQGGK